MSEKAPNTAISAIIVIIVIFLVVIVFLTLFTDSSSQITDIFDEVFYDEQSEDAKKTTVKTQAALIETINKCSSDPVINPSGASDCFCHAGLIGKISDNSYLSVQNSNNALTITAFDSDGAPLAQEQESYNLGLFVVKNVNNGQELGCVFPEQFFIKGTDEDTIGFNSEESFFGIGENIDNNWYVIWKEQDDSFGFYGDKSTGSSYEYATKLKAAPILYKISDRQYCIMTDLLEYPLEDVSGLDYEPIEPIRSTEEFLDITNFFTDDAVYCNKCSTTSCEKTESESALALAKEAISEYKSCLASTTDCTCSLDLNFLSEKLDPAYAQQYGTSYRYLLIFSSDEVKLFDLKLQKKGLIDSFSTQIAPIAPSTYGQFFNDEGPFYVFMSEWDILTEQEIQSESDATLKELEQSLATKYGYGEKVDLLTVSPTDALKTFPEFMPTTSDLSFTSNKIHFPVSYEEQSSSPECNT
ncbi:MAG: hypothetical protein Q8R18_04885 [bacterium]|nr:hypothetical protein [bacterium]